MVGGIIHLRSVNLLYSGTSDNGPSEIGSTSLQGTISPKVSLVWRFHCIYKSFVTYILTLMMVFSRAAGLS